MPHKWEGVCAGEARRIFGSTCFTGCAVSHHSLLNAMGRLLQMISYFLSSLQHFSLALAHNPFCSQELQPWPVSSSDRWRISPCAGSVSWSNAAFSRKITGSAVIMPVFAPEFLAISGSISDPAHEAPHNPVTWICGADNQSAIPSLC